MSNCSISFLQWNCSGIQSKKKSILKLLDHYDLVAFNETWLKPNNNFNLPAFQI